MKIGVYSDTTWALGRIFRDVEKSLPQHTFKYVDWSIPIKSLLQDLYIWCDIMIVSLAGKEHILSVFNNPSKILFLSCGFEENQGRFIDPRFVYAIASNSILPLFPIETKVFLTPIGVDPNNFDYTFRNGNIKTLGWCGNPKTWYKKPMWVIDIAKQTNTVPSIASNTPCETDISKWVPLKYDEVRKWYSKIDLLLVTSPPEAKYETGPLPAFEAIVSGLAVVGTPVGNFRHIPGPKFTTIEEGVEIVSQLKSNPERVKSLAKEQYKYVMKNYTYQSFADKWNDAFSYVLDLNVNT